LFIILQYCCCFMLVPPFFFIILALGWHASLLRVGDLVGGRVAGRFVVGAFVGGPAAGPARVRSSIAISPTGPVNRADLATPEKGGAANGTHALDSPPRPAGSSQAGWPGAAPHAPVLGSTALARAAPDPSIPSCRATVSLVLEERPCR
jgi:hypothetical protein